MADLIFLPIADQIESGTYLVYDGACGTGGMLTVAEARRAELARAHGKEVSIHLFGQEVNPETYAITKADLLLKGEGAEAENFYLGSTLPHESIQLLPGQLRGALIRGTLSPELTQPEVTLIANLLFSHLAELMQIDGPLKRTFYEIESLRGRWSVRELKRQIASLYYERSHLSHDRQKLAELARASADQATPAQIIRDPYIFEFLGLQPQEVMSESALENALFDKLHDFLLEVGRGFCFEARQSAFSSATNIFPSIWSSITAFSNVTS